MKLINILNSQIFHWIWQPIVLGSGDKPTISFARLQRIE
jgi:hypothetical protein